MTTQAQVTEVAEDEVPMLWTPIDAAILAGRSIVTFRRWLAAGQLLPVARTSRGVPLFRHDDVMACKAQQLGRWPKTDGSARTDDGEATRGG